MASKMANKMDVDEENLQDMLDRSVELEQTDIEESVKVLRQVIESNTNDPTSKEQAIYKLGELLTTNGRAAELGQLLKEIRPFFTSISKAKTEKIVRELINLVAKIPDTCALQIDLCKECIEWAKEEKRAILRQRLQSRLAALYFQSEEHVLSLAIIQPLLKEVKRLDDKHLLIEINLVETQVQHRLRNLPKAKAALTSARTYANAVHCPPLLQGRIDMQSGILHSEERDYKTAYSYFYEAFESYNSQDAPEAVQALKYMLLAKIMTNSPEDVHSILSGKLALKYQGREMEAMHKVATAHKNRSLSEFEEALAAYPAELGDDVLIERHLAELQDTMLQQNLCRLIEPFSCVEIAHVADLIGLDLVTVEKKLSQMILDKKFAGILDQGNGWLTLFHDPKPSDVYKTSLETIDNLNGLVDQLYDKAKQLS